MPKTLVLGSENFIGKPLMLALRASGRSTPVQADVARLDAAFLIGCEAVINCTIGTPQAIQTAAETLYALAAELPNPPRIVHLSSMTVYGTATGLVNEDTPLRDDLGAYGAAQIAAEKRAFAYPRGVILRPGCEYGRDCPQWSTRVARWLRAGRLGNLGETGSGHCNLLHIDDLVAALLAASTLPNIEGKAFNLASATPTWNDYFQRFATALGALPVRNISSNRLMIETKLLAIPLKILEIIASKLLGRSPAWLPPAIPPSLPGLCRQDIRLDVSRAEAQLGLRWTGLDDGLRSTAESLREGG